jgi:ribosomal protein S18 acetylase RimI-like enzyme
MLWVQHNNWNELESSTEIVKRTVPLTEGTIIRSDSSYKEDCAKLHFMAGPELYRYIYCNENDKVLKIIEMYFEMPGTPCSKQYSYIDVADGAVRGYMLGYPVREIGKMARSIILGLGKLMKLCGFSNMMVIIFHALSIINYFPKLDKNEYFLSNLAVYQEYRGQGVGTGLLEKAEEVAKAMGGLKKLSLYVEVDNPGAIRLYEKYGFIKVDEVILPQEFREEHHFIGFNKMIKDIK